MSRLLDWLEGFPGESGQDRWLVSGSDELGVDWGPPTTTAARRHQTTLALTVLIALRAVHPSYDCSPAAA